MAGSTKDYHHPLIVKLRMAGTKLTGSLVVLIGEVIISVFQLEKSCSPFDYQVQQVRKICPIFIALFFAVLIFSGYKSSSLYNLWIKVLTVDWIYGCFRLIYLTSGIWTRSNIQAFDVINKAAKYDNDDSDDNNQQQKVISLLGQSTGLIRLLVPFGVVLTKLAEITDNPPDNYGSFQLKSSLFKRAALFLCNIFRYVGVLYVVFKATELGVSYYQYQY
jgi:hypothetical protein